MKQVVFGVTAGMLVVMFLGLIITVHGRTIRANEAGESLEHAMRTAMEQLADESYTFADREEFIADFLEALLIQISSDSDLTLNVLHADEARGLLSVELVEHYRHPNGEIGAVSIQRTILLDKQARAVG